MGRKNKYNTDEERLEARRKTKREYYQRNCEEINLNKKKWYSENKEKKNQYYLDNKKPLTDEDKTKRKLYMVVYHEENRELEKEYRLKNKEKIAENNKKWSANTPEKNREKTKRWRLNNPDKARVSDRVSRKKRIDLDPVFRLSCNVRSMLCKVIKRQGYSKKTRSYKIIGCSFDEFKNHIESQWEDWVSWDNYGIYNGNEKYGWDIDHINPISTATSEEEVLNLNHHSNLQPLCSKINRDIKIDKIN